MDKKTRDEVDGVLTELGGFIEEELSATAMALGGLRLLAAQLSRSLPPATDDGDGDTFLVGVDVPEVGWLLRIDGAVAAGTYLADLTGGGLMVQRLTQQFIVRLYAAWEEEFRERLATAHGLSQKDDLKSVFFGDLGRLRHDVVHNRGRVSSRTAAGCSVVGRPLEREDPIYLSDTDLQGLRFRVPWSELRHATDTK